MIGEQSRAGGRGCDRGFVHPDKSVAYASEVLLQGKLANKIHTDREAYVQIARRTEKETFQSSGIRSEGEFRCMWRFAEITTDALLINSEVELHPGAMDGVLEGDIVLEQQSSQLRVSGGLSNILAENSLQGFRRWLRGSGRPESFIVVLAVRN